MGYLLQKWQSRDYRLSDSTERVQEVPQVETPCATETDQGREYQHAMAREKAGWMVRANAENVVLST